MGKTKDLTGQKRLTALHPAGKNKQKAFLWRCSCACGCECIVEGRNLSAGRTRSCGCLDREAHQNRPNRTTHGMYGSRLYRIWKKMKSRCHNPNDPDYKAYGAKGIFVCESWRTDFQVFYEWAMSHGYTDDLSIDRIDNDKGYSPDNCRWATALEQMHNQKRCSKGGDSDS